VRRRRSARASRALVVVGALAWVLSGCASTQQPEVQRVATSFEDSGADPGARCDLLTPKALAALEKSESQPCADAIGQLPLDGGTVRSVQVWGGDAQVKLSGDTVFLTETSGGWKVSAAACTPNADAPYDCEVTAG
jgi:hypothetical protein